MLHFAWFLLCGSSGVPETALSARRALEAAAVPLNWSWAVEAFWRMNFDIVWHGASDVRTSYTGYGTRLRIGDYENDAYMGGTMTLFTVSLSTRVVQLTQYSILAIFLLTDSGGGALTSDVAIFSDTVVGISHIHATGVLPGRSGLWWRGQSDGIEYSINVIGAGCPLVTDMTGYWFGNYYIVDTEMWELDPPHNLTGIDVAFAVSWQGIHVVEPTWRSVLFRSGDVVEDPPTITAAVSAPQVPATGSVAIEANLLGGTSLSVYAVPDGNIWRLTLVAENLGSGTSDLLLSLRNWELEPGSRVISLYAVSALGFVSEAANVAVTVIPGPTRTVPQTPTLTNSPLPSQSVDPHPSPHPTSFPLVWASDLWKNFDLFWQNTAPVRTTWNGYDTVLRVGEVTRNAYQTMPVQLGSITLRTVVANLSRFTVIVAFQLNNAGASAVSCDVAVYADCTIGATDHHRIGTTDNGIFWDGRDLESDYLINVIGRQYPLVTDISSYWFGPTRLLSQRIWNQTMIPVFVSPDVAMSFSWQSVEVPANGATTKAVIFRSGEHFVDQPTIGVVNLQPGNVPAHGSLSVQFDVLDNVTGTGMNIWGVADNDFYTISLVVEGVETGQQNSFVNLSPFLLSPGHHQLSFYAVNDLGFVSYPTNLEIDVIPDPTATTSKSPTHSQSPTMSRTPTPSRSPLATAGQTPTPNRTPAYGRHPILLVPYDSSFYNFDIRWVASGGYSPSIQTALGYGTVLRANGTTVFAARGLPVSTSSITLTTMNRTLSEFSILVIFALRNAGPDPVVCDVCFYADTRIGANESHIVETLPDRQGFFWSGHYLRTEYTMNPVIRHHPLVSDASAYWFGDYRQMGQNYWNQTILNRSVGIDVGITVSWQNISVAGNGSQNVTIIFQSGIRNGGRPVVSDAAAGLDGFVLFNETLPVRFSVSELRPDGWIRVFVVFDGDVTRITQIPGNWSGRHITGEIDPELHLLGRGNHDLSLYAVEDLGSVSDPASVRVSVVDELPKAKTGNAGATAAIVIVVIILAGGGAAFLVWWLRRRRDRPHEGFTHVGEKDMKPGGVAL